MIINSGNPMLDKNLAGIARYNPELVEEILKITSLKNLIELTETKLQEPNLLFNGIPLHSPEGADEEIKNVFSQILNNKNSRHFVIGMGLGYLFKECCEKSKGVVMLYESNLEILRVTLEIVDFSKELFQPNVFVASDTEFLKRIYYTHKDYQLNYSILTLDSYQKFVYNDQMQEINEQILSAFRIINTNFNVLKLDEFVSIQFTMDNLPKTLDGIPLKEIAGCYKGKTAVVVSAGPTLDENIEAIKKNRDKFVLFTVGAALKSLLKNGIVPDFANVIEQNDFSGQFSECDLSDINLIIEPLCNSSFYNLKPKKMFMYPSEIRNANAFWAKITGTDISGYMSGGTVSYQALESAKLLGCEKLILVGQDLAFLDNKCYAKGSAYDGLTFKINEDGGAEFENSEADIDSYKSIDANIPEDVKTQIAADIVKARVTITQDAFYYVKGINGDMLPTYRPYALFADNLADFAYENKGLDLINTSMRGAQINGFKNIPFEQAIKDVSNFDRSVVSPNFKFDKKKVLNNLKFELDELKSMFANFPKAFEFISKYEKELNLRRTFTDKSLKYIQELVGIYKYLSTQGNSMYYSISLNEDIEIMYKMNETENFDVNAAKEIFALLKTYFFNNNDKIHAMIARIEGVINLLGESVS